MSTGWIKIKKYPHIGLPITSQKLRGVISYIRNKKKISRHAFLPLIRKTQKKHRYITNEKGKKHRIVKLRPISYASHLDALIYSYYAKSLGIQYETYIKKHHLENHVIAYRSVPKLSHSNKCNIDFAKDAFDYIKKNISNNELTVIVSDISSFFDELDHEILKKHWKEVCNVEKLEEDEYNVFRNVTRYSYIKIEDLFNLFKDRIICKKNSTYINLPIKKEKYLRNKNAVAFCKKDDMPIIRSKGIICSNKKPGGLCKGIPQGLPISSILANVYMIHFDESAVELANKIGGFYYRYSDDIIFICSATHKDEVLCKIDNYINAVKLQMSQKKTKIHDIVKDENGNIIVKSDGKPSQIEYLGFLFDGNNILVKKKGISLYYLKMRKNVNCKIWYAKHMHNSTRGKLFENQLLRKFTPIGSRRHKIYRHEKEGKKNNYTGCRSFGNFWTYINKSAIIMESNQIRMQLKNNKKILKKHILRSRKIVGSK